MTSAVLSALVLCAAAFLCADAAAGNERSSRPQIHLHSGTIDVLSQPRWSHNPAALPRVTHYSKRRSLQGLFSASPGLWGKLSNAQQLLISYEKPRQADVLERVQKTLHIHGGWLSSYLPDNAVLGVGNKNAAAECQKIEGVTWVGEYAAEHKIAPELSTHISETDSDAVLLAVSFPFLHNFGTDQKESVGGHDPGKAAETEWPAELKKAGWSASVKRLNPHMVLIKADTTAIQGTAITQSANAAPSAPIGLTQDQGTHPIWEAGLTGTGQIIGGGDSGMDYNNCFFADPSAKWNASLQTDSKSGIISFNSTSHRKIRLYRALGNGIDMGGHGTHTMGSLLGSSLNQSNLYDQDYRGMAPDAKLAFNDLGSSDTDGIFTPEDLSTSYYSFAYDVGARVHSDSWGSGSVSYDYMAAQVDYFTWQNQDFLPVFAAGNEGAASVNNSQGATTVTSPATAKNCITAGATEVAGQSHTSNPQFVTADMTLHQPLNSSGADSIVERYLVMQASFGGQVRSIYKQQLTISVASPSDGCMGLQNPANVNGTIVLIQRGTCYMSSKVANAQAAGAVAALIYDNQINDYFLMAADGTSAATISIPAVSVPRRIGQLLLSSAQSGGQLKVSFGETTVPQEAWANLASFSSKGPTPDGRVKPDLLAPGTLQSAYTDPNTKDTCALQTMQGTSMATPLIAGSAALVRQYFLSGSYPTGAPTADNAFAPSGALVKATLIGGASGLLGFEPDTGLPLAPPPSYRQGFGRVHLSQSLPLQDSGPGWSLQVIDMANLTTGESHQYCLNGTGGPLAVTLVWHDYPASLAAAKSLVNDLDLSVRAAGMNGVPLLGNGGDQATNVPDRTNNVEQVSLSYLPAGEIAIQVDGHQVYSAQGPQPYALAVHGKFSGVLLSPSNPVNGGNSTSGICKLVVAQITDGPIGLTNATEIAFQFGLQAGPSAGAAFECALTLSEGAINSSSQFAACTSPVKYQDLEDGGYTFFVRAQGEQIADSRAFFKDTTPPALEFLEPLISNLTASAVANFTFNATDESAVNMSCRLTASDSAASQGDVHLLQPNGPILDSTAALGAWKPCYSPLALAWLLPGQWKLEVTAMDGAGNAAAKNLEQPWTVAYDASNAIYTRFTEAPLGLTGSIEPSFSLKAIQQDSNGVVSEVDSQKFECLLFTRQEAASVSGNLTAAAQLAFSTADSEWKACNQKPRFGELADGTWAIAARAAASSSASDSSPDQLAITSFTIASEPPTIEISEAPEIFANSSTVSFQFLSNSTGTSFACALNSGNVTEMNATDFQPCASPQQYTALQDGAYTFAVSGTNRVGLSAPPEEADFFVDTRPPVFSDIRYPIAVRGGAVTVTFGVSDGLMGAGVADVKCRLRAVKLVQSAQNQTGNGSWQQCKSPHTFSNPGQGHWGLSLKATDRAGLQTVTT